MWGDSGDHTPRDTTASEATPVRAPLYRDRLLEVRPAETPEAITLSGEVDFTNSAALTRLLEQIRARHGAVFVDTAGLRYADVSGWRALTAPHLPEAERPRLTRVAPCLSRLTALLSPDTPRSPETSGPVEGDIKWFHSRRSSGRRYTWPGRFGHSF